MSDVTERRMILSRRGLIAGLGALVAAPAIVHATSIMPVKLWKPVIGKWRHEVWYNGDTMQECIDHAEGVQVRDAMNKYGPVATLVSTWEGPGPVVNFQEGGLCVDVRGRGFSQAIHLPDSDTIKMRIPHEWKS